MHELEREATTIGPEIIPREEVPMVRRDPWEQIGRLWFEQVSIAEIARRCEVDG